MLCGTMFEAVEDRASCVSITGRWLWNLAKEEGGREKDKVGGEEMGHTL